MVGWGGIGKLLSSVLCPTCLRWTVHVSALVLSLSFSFLGVQLILDILLAQPTFSPVGPYLYHYQRHVVRGSDSL